MEQPAGNRFCGQCGSILTHEGGAGSSATQATHSQRAGERRQMTIMFYDLVGSTALASNCDPEDFGEAVASFHDAVGAAVRSLGGYVGSRVGDGAVVYFGYPEAQEDAAERAVLAGLRAVTATRRLVLPDGETARIRVGVATGEGIINLSENGEGNEVVGNVANLAARLQSSAPPQSVIVSDGTRRVLGGSFELVDIGQIDVKGFAAPVQAWRVADQPQRDPVELNQQSVPLVGREAERATMRAALDRALSGENIALLLIGDAGVGKSHLSTAFVMDDHAVSVIRHVFSCAAHSMDTPFHPFMPQLLRASSGASAWASGTDSEDAAMLARIAGFETRKSETLPGLTAAQRLERTIDALVRQFELFSRQQPLILLFEDAHWADPTSLTVLDRAIRDGKFGQALLIITARAEFAPQWADLPHVQTIRLRPLESTDADNLVLSVPGADSLPPSIRRAILRRADGIPLFLEELTRSTVERAAEGVGISVDEFELPMSLQDSLLARLDRLGPAKRIAQVASVIGRRFTRDVLAKLAEVPEEEIERSLARLTESGLVGTDDSRGHEQFLFRHVLIQEAAYATLLRADRKRLNLRLLEQLQAALPEVSRNEPERLAHYAAEGDQPGVAAGFWLEAGLAALANSAMPEAKARILRGLACAARMAEGDERTQCELQLQLALGKALIATVGYAVPETTAAFERALELCSTKADRPELLAVLHGLWIIDLLCGRLHSAKERADELLKVAETVGDPVWVVVGCRAQGVLAYPLGNFVDSIAYLERGLATFEESKRQAYSKILVDDPRVVMLMYLGLSLCGLGRIEEALATSAEAVAEAHRLGHPYSIAQALSGQISVFLLSQRLDGAAAKVSELARVTSEHEIVYHGVVAEIQRGYVALKNGAIREGISIMSAGLARYRKTGSVLYVPTYQMWLVEALIEDGQYNAALDEISSAEKLIADTQMACHSAGIAMLRAELHRRQGDYEAAGLAIENAIDIATRQGAASYADQYRETLTKLDADAPRARQIQA